MRNKQVYPRVHKRGSRKNYELEYLDKNGQRQRVSTGTEIEESAVQFLNNFIGHKRETVLAKVMTVSQVLDFWNEQRQKKGKAKLFTNRVYEFMGDVPANTMTAKLCRDYTAWRQTNTVAGFGWHKSSFKKPRGPSL